MRRKPSDPKTSLSSLSSADRFAGLVAGSHIIAVGLEAPLAGNPRLQACAHCGSAFLPTRAPCRGQRFCSVRCSVIARPARPGKTAAQRQAIARERFILRLLDVQPLERRARGGWRFGTRRISDRVVARLIASGRAELVGEGGRWLQPAPQQAGEPA